MMSPKAYIEIYEEPASKLKRFRYESEGRSAPLEGVRTKQKEKSYPSIRIVNYTGKATVVVSCVTVDEPYRQHPHKLVGKNCVNGICYIPEFDTDSGDPTVLSFPELRIQSCLITEIPQRLEERKRLNINPFDLSECGEDDLRRDIHKVRLCFQVLISPNPNDPTFRTQFEPKVSQPITNNKAAADVKIHDISDIYSPACGGKKIMILCNKIAKDDIQIRFYEEDVEKKQTIIGLGCFKPHNVHRDVAIAFTTPKYDIKSVDQPPSTFIEMFRPSDQARSNRIVFQYVHDVTNIDAAMLRKKQKVDQSMNLCELFDSLSYNNIRSYIQEERESQEEFGSVQQHHIRQQQHNIPPNHNIAQEHNLSQQEPQSLQHNQSPTQQHNLPQGHNLSQHQYNPSPQYNIPQQHTYNVPHQHIPQEQLNPQQQYNPQDQYNLQNPNYYPQRLLTFEDLTAGNPSGEGIPPIYSQEDHVMLSTNDIWNSEHNVAGPSPKNWNLL